MAIIRTPEERFKDLPGYPFEPRYVEVKGLRMHYVDEGSGEEVALLLHGEPSWSYLYRKMIPPLASRFRVVAPDFIGFGKSDKLTEVSDYTYELHRDALREFIEALDLRNIMVVVQDWGGLVGLRVVTLMPERFSRLVIMNTGLPTGEEKVPEAFMRWRNFVEKTEDLPIGMIIKGAVANPLPPEVVAAYDAPFPGPEFKAGAKAWPLMVPVSPDSPVSPEMRAAREGLARWTKPALVLFSDKDPITRGGDKAFKEKIPGAAGQPHATIENAGHFLQEDKGEEIAERILDWNP